MNFSHLEYFIEVAHCGSISKASEKLFLDRGSLSATIASLEKEYGVPFFLRTSKGVSLTEYGKRFYEFSLHVLEAQKNLKQQFSDIEESVEKVELRIYFPNGLNTVAFFDIFNSFKENIPNVTLTIVETNIYKKDFQSLSDDELFIYFFIATDEDEVMALESDSRFIIHLIERNAPFAYCAEEHLLASYKSVAINTLKDFEILLYSSELIDPKNGFLGIDSKQINIASNFSLFKHMLSTGKYIAIGSDRNNAVDMREYVRIPITDAPPFLFYVAVNRESIDVPVIKAFLKLFFDYENLPYPEILRQRT